MTYYPTLGLLPRINYQNTEMVRTHSEEREHIKVAVFKTSKTGRKVKKERDASRREQ